MKSITLRSACKAVLIGTALLSLQACAPSGSQSSKEISVAGAFESSNVITVKPYTRTIFSSNDF